MLPFWSSYELIPYAYTSESMTPRMWQGPDYRVYAFPVTVTCLQRRLDEVYFPSQKVELFDLFDRHSYKRTIFHAYEVAAQPLAFFDGSVSIRKTKDSNPGWNPQTPSGTGPTIYVYRPTSPGDPPSLSGNATGDNVVGHYRWTRAGLKGVDFGGGEQWQY
jgi:hypothetical protein